MVFGVFGVLISGGVPQSAQAETLADALAQAYRNSNLLEQNRALLRATDEDVVQAASALRPVVEFVASALTNSDGAPAYSVSASLNLSMSLIDFGRGRLQVDAAREQVLATRQALTVVEQSVLGNAARAYLNLYSKLQSVQLARSAVGVINEQLRAAQERFELGDSTRTDVAIAEARLAAARSSLAAAQGDAAVAREEYNLAVGRYPSSVAAPPGLPRLPASLEAAQDIARRQHPAIIQAQHAVAAADLVAQISGRQRYGTVTGSLSASTSSTDTTLGGHSSSSGVNASVRYAVPIYNAGRLDSAERQAVARGEAQRASLHQTVAVIQQAVAANWSMLQVARARVAAADLQIRASESAYEGIRAEAELGSRTTLDLLNAEQELLDARLARIQASAGVQQTAYGLLESMGQMTVQALNLGIPTYDVEAYADAFATRGSSAPRVSEQGRSLDRILGRFQRP